MQAEVPGVVVRRLAAGDRPWLRDLVEGEWGLPVVSRSGVHDPAAYDGFVAHQHGTPVGALTYLVTGDECEIVTVNSLREGCGVGRALMAAAVRAARRARCRRVWLLTSNENIRAIAFYQRFGMDLRAVHRDFADEVRRHKRDLITTGTDGIEFRHALEFELLLR